MTCFRRGVLSVVVAACAFATAQARYPVVVENCGNTLRFEEAPERVASLYSATTELLLRLGLGERIVLAANFGETLPDDLQGAYENLNLVGQDFIIPREVLLSAQPDLVMDNQPDWFYSSENGFASVEDIASVGGQVYTLTAKCGGGRIDATFEDNYTDLRNVGNLFGVQGRADTLIAEMKATVAEVQRRTAGRTAPQVMLYDAGEGPLGVFGPGTYDFVLELAGGQNAFADLPDSYAQVSVEEVATRDIEVVIVAGYERDEARAQFIRDTFPNLPAVQNDRVYVVPYGLMNPGVRNHLGVEAFAKALFPEAFR